MTITAPCQMIFEDRNSSADRAAFDTFVVGPSNEAACHAACAVAAGLDACPNPLILCGGPGLGKTHLLQAIETAARTVSPDARIIRCSTEAFMCEYVCSLKRAHSDQFLKKYHTAALLLMDDIQVIAGKPHTQETLCSIFHTLSEGGCRIVLSMGCPPDRLDLLTERIAGEFERSLLAEIKEPEYRTRLTIVRDKAAQRGLPLQPGQAEYIAARITGSVCRIEGLLNKLKFLNQIGSSFQLKDIVDSVA